MSYALQAEGLVKRFKDTTALDGVDLQVRPGSVLGLLGPNGAGKTTTVRVFATLLRADAGRATVGGLDVVRDAYQVRRLIGLTGQYAALDEELTGRQNLVLVGRLLDLSRRDARRRAEDLLEMFSLADAGNRQVKTFSGGMRRRLDLAASMIGEPEILFLDEPTTGLDPRSRAEVWQLVRDLVDDGVTVLLTTQYLDEADRLADEIAVIDHGRVVAEGSADDLKRKVGNQTLQIHPVDAARRSEAAGILERIAGCPVTSPPEGGPLTVQVGSNEALPAVVRALDDAGIVVDELALRLPSLDEVFLAITGAPTDQTPAEQNSPGADGAATQKETAA